MPILGFGTWRCTDDTASTIQEVLDMGYHLIDTSGDYGTQPDIRAGMRESDIDRSEIYVVTKVEEYEDAYESAKRNVDELGLVTADLILIHRPPKDGVGEELWRGLMRAKEEGLTQDIGVSNYSVAQIEELIRLTDEVPAVNQIEWTPFGHDDEMLQYATERDICIQAYSPLTRGNKLGNEDLNEIAMRYGKTPAQVLIRWNIELGIVPLPKANNLKHAVENLDVFDFELTVADIEQLKNLNERYSALGSLTYVS